MIGLLRFLPYGVIGVLGVLLIVLSGRLETAVAKRKLAEANLSSVVETNQSNSTTLRELESALVECTRVNAAIVEVGEAAESVRQSEVAKARAETARARAARDAALQDSECAANLKMPICPGAL